MSEALYVVGDSLTVLRQLPAASVDLIVTSPPFLALRSYLPADDPAKPFEIGQEATPGAFIDVLLDLTEEWARVLTPRGSMVVELGDTYSGSGGAGGDYGSEGMRGGQQKFKGSALKDRKNKVLNADGQRLQQGPGWPLAKSLTLIPEMYRMALAYGVNPLTGRETDPWRIRNVIRWCRPNPPVGALGDKFRPGTSELVVACKSGSRWFDLDAVRVPFTGNEGVGTGQRKGQNGTQSHDNRPDDMPTRKNTHDGAPPLDWWKISTEGYPGSHYATFPSALVVKPIQSMCPREVCRVCGTPRERLTSEPTYTDAAGNDRTEDAAGWESAGANGNRGPNNGRTDGGTIRQVTTTGWSDCGHGDYRPGRVLDPFAGTGTVGAVATGHNRDALLIDLDARNAELARERVGMWLSEATVAEASAWLTREAGL